MKKKNIIIQNIGKFRDNYIAYYIKKYIKSDSFYNFGWGNLNVEMIKFGAPKINFNKKLIGLYNNSIGNDDLISEIIKFINSKSDFKFNKENIIITNGVTNSIFLLSHYFKHFLEINTILLQNPTYDTAINIFRSQDYNIKTINPDLSGEIDNNIKLSYLMFKFQNPTGAYIEKNKSEKSKKKLLKTSYLIEDDSYGLLEDHSEINIMHNKKYIYLSSFSKYIFPGLRIGYVVADKDIINKLKIIQKYYNSHPNILSQMMLLDYLKTGKIYDEIKNKVQILNKKQQLFENSLLPKIRKLTEYNKKAFYYWFKFPQRVDINKLFIELLKNKILVIPGDIYFINNKYNALRACLSPTNSKDIPVAAKKLSKIMEKYV